jgi:hypothetical protein
VTAEVAQAAAASAPLGGHLWHLIAVVVPALVAVIVVVVERARGPRQSRDEYIARPAARALLTADSFGTSARPHSGHRSA